MKSQIKSQKHKKVACLSREISHFYYFLSITQWHCKSMQPQSSHANQPKMLMRMPAATALPITPATLGPIACISRKFWGFSFWPTF